MSNQQAPKVLAFAAAANEVSKRYQTLKEKVAATEKQAAAEADQLKAGAEKATEAMLEHERIFGHQKEAVAERLSDPEGGHAACLELIPDLAAHRNAAEVAAIGSPVGPEKKASARMTGAPTADFDETEAGQKFRQILSGGSQ